MQVCVCVCVCVSGTGAYSRVMEGQDKTTSELMPVALKGRFFFLAMFFFRWRGQVTKKKRASTSPDVTTLEWTPVALEEGLFFHRFFFCVCIVKHLPSEALALKRNC
jgi:hypothetical protein